MNTVYVNTDVTSVCITNFDVSNLLHAMQEFSWGYETGNFRKKLGSSGTPSLEKDQNKSKLKGV